MTTLPALGEEPLLIDAPELTDVTYWSATTIIGVVDKPALVAWAALETAKAAIDDQAIWRARLEHEGRDEALAWLKNSRYRKRKGQRSSTALGTAVHKACEHKAIFGSYRPQDVNDTELLPFLMQFDRFLDEFQPTYEAAEVTVFSPTYGYAGTCDGFMQLQLLNAIFDIKTSREDYLADGKLRTPFPEVALQLSAYRYAELAAVWRARQSEQFKRRYYLLSQAERDLAVPVPEADIGVALLLTPTRYALHSVECGPEVHDVFLHLIDVASYQFGPATSAVGRALIPPYPRPVDDSDPFAGIGE